MSKIRIALPRPLLSRALKSNLRDTVLLFREFRSPLLLFSAAIIGMGALYYFIAMQTGDTISGVAEGIYIVLTATFLQPFGSFQHSPFLQIILFLMPLVGVGTLAQGLADFGVLLFNRRARGKDWEMAVASTFQNHMILVGLGHLGFRVATQLHQMDQEVVAVELSPSAELVASIRQLDIPVIPGDGTKEEMLEAAGIRHARAIVLCTQNDSLNLQMAVKARGINPNIHVVIRIFDNDFAAALQKQFGFSAISATGMAAPVFAAAASGVNVTPPIMVEGHPLCFGTIAFAACAPTVGISLHDLEKQYRVSAVMLRRGGDSMWHPSGEEVIQAEDIVGVLGKPERINQIAHDCK
jgi:voltage-gated potassium channel